MESSDNTPKYYSVFEVDATAFEYVSDFCSQRRGGDYSHHIEDITTIYGNTLVGFDRDEKYSKETKESLHHIIDDAHKIMVEHNIGNVDLDYGLIEYHYYDKPNQNWLTIHQDSFAAVNYEVNTVIFYFNKTLEGGNLEIYDNVDGDNLLDSIDITPSDGKVKIVVMSGDVFHTVSPIMSEGIRESIVIQLRRI